MAETYKVGISIVVMGGAQAEAQLNAIKESMVGLGQKVDETGKKFDVLGTIFKAEFILQGLEQIGTKLMELTDKAGQFQTAMNRLSGLGGYYASKEGQDEASRYSFAAARNMPVFSATEHGTMLAEALDVTRVGGVPEAQALSNAEALETALGAKAALISGVTGESAQTIAQNILRDLSVRGSLYGANGQLDLVKANAGMEDDAKIIRAGGGMIKASDLLQMHKQAGGALEGLSLDEQGRLATVGLGMGYSRAGTAYTSFQRQFVGGKMTGPTAGEMVQLGILRPDEVEKMPGGKISVTREGTDRMQREFAKDGGMLGWMSQELPKILAGKGFTTPEAQEAEIAKLAGTQTVARLIMDAIKNAPELQQVGKNLTAMPNSDDTAQQRLQTDYATNKKALEEMLNTFETGVGLLIAPTVVKGMHALTDELGAFTAVIAPGGALEQNMPKIKEYFTEMDTVFTSIATPAKKLVDAMAEVVAEVIKVDDAFNQLVAGLVHTATGMVNGVMGRIMHPFGGSGDSAAPPATPSPGAPPAPDPNKHADNTPVNLQLTDRGGTVLANIVADKMTRHGSQRYGSAEQDPSAVPYRPGVNYNAGF